MCDVVNKRRAISALGHRPSSVLGDLRQYDLIPLCQRAVDAVIYFKPVSAANINIDINNIDSGGRNRCDRYLLWAPACFAMLLRYSLMCQRFRTYFREILYICIFRYRADIPFLHKCEIWVRSEPASFPV